MYSVGMAKDVQMHDQGAKSCKNLLKYEEIHYELMLFVPIMVDEHLGKCTN